MLVYSLIMFAVAALCLWIGISIYRGNTNLIHDYHRTRIKESERLAYGRAFAKGLFVLCGGLFLSGAISLFGDSKPFVLASDAVLAAGIVISIVMIMRVQRKYNGGLF